MKIKQVYLYFNGELMIYDGDSIEANENLIYSMFGFGITIDDVLSVSEYLGDL